MELLSQISDSGRWPRCGSGLLVVEWRCDPTARWESKSGLVDGWSFVSKDAGIKLN